MKKISKKETVKVVEENKVTYSSNFNVYANGGSQNKLICVTLSQRAEEELEDTYARAVEFVESKIAELVEESAVNKTSKRKNALSFIKNRKKEVAKEEEYDEEEEGEDTYVYEDEEEKPKAKKKKLTLKTRTVIKDDYEEDDEEYEEEKPKAKKKKLTLKTSTVIKDDYEEEDDEEYEEENEEEEDDENIDAMINKYTKPSKTKTVQKRKSKMGRLKRG